MKIWPKGGVSGALWRHINMFHGRKSVSGDGGDISFGERSEPKKIFHVPSIFQYVPPTLGGTRTEVGGT